MAVTAVVGANWGDEGKGKVTDVLAGQYRYVVRFQGGSNAGHTVMNEYGTFALHMLPSGVFYPDVGNVIGPGVALDVRRLLDERDGLLARGVPEPKLFVSERAQIVLPVHRLLDELEEERLGDSRFGSTKSGIAPFYADKCLKLGVQVAELYDPDRLKNRIEASLQPKRVLLEHRYGRATAGADEMIGALLGELLADAERLKPFVCDTTALLREALARGEAVLAEGQLGALRDPDHGIYPYTTSSSTLAGFAAVGAGLPPGSTNRVIAVTKAYSTCVGAGPFVTELFGDAAELLRRRGGHAGEYGATTGRPRRVGWFDASATRYGCMLQGATEAALTNLDVLGYLPRIPVCVGYELDGRTAAAAVATEIASAVEIASAAETTFATETAVATEIAAAAAPFPAGGALERARPVYDIMPGWGSDISQAASFGDLPEEARRYVLRIEQLIGVPIRFVSVGPRREQWVEKPGSHIVPT